VLERTLERFLFSSHGCSRLFYVGLVVALGVLLLKSAQELFRFVGHAFQGTENDAILGVLTLVDLTLTGSLVVIVIFSGYENFVSKIDEDTHKDWPDWMGKIDFAGLKLKLLSSIVAISAIQLLKVFMNLKNTSDRDLLWSAAIHLVFVISGIFMALTDRLSEGGPQGRQGGVSGRALRRRPARGRAGPIAPICGARPPGPRS
jgi:uncharacterized protein (TIGR00645 family)